MRRSAAWLLAFVSSVAPACHPPAPESKPRAEEPGALARMDRVSELYAEGRVAEAMDQLRQEIADPVMDHDKWRSAIRLWALQLLGDLAELRGVDRELDAEAERYRTEAEKATRDSPTRAAQLGYIWGVFQLRAGRPAEALKTLRGVEEAWSTNVEVPPFDRIRFLGEMAAAHTALGHPELAERLDATALERARAYIANPPSYTYHEMTIWRGEPKRLGEIDLLGRIVERRARTGGPEGLREPWRIESELLAKVDAAPSVRAIAHARAARAFARAGAIADGRALLEAARGFAKTADASGADPDRTRLVTITAADLDLADGHADRAVASLGPVVAEAERRGARVDPALRTALGLGLEAAGDLTAAARQFGEATNALEAARGGQDVASRRAFFTADARLPYWGLVRVLARRAAATGAPADFFEALRASERVRSRQLGELLAERGLEVQGAADLAAVRGLVDPHELWLDFVVTDRGTVLLAMTRDTQRAAVLALDERALSARVEKLRSHLVQPRPPSDRAARDRELAALSADLLGPVAALCEGKDRWVVLPDANLALLPLDLLAPPGSGPAIDKVEVRIAPSISLLFAKPKSAAATGGLFAVGDPLFADVTPASSSERAAGDRGRLAPLPETRAEIAGVAALFPPASVTTLFGDRAAESAVKRTDLRRFAYLHFATHGILGGQLAGLDEPALALTREAGEDGFLTASEIERLDLAADVAVLSACDTGRGRYMSGEGVLGVGRAFLVAGARSVVVSLWPVDSLATADLMVAFYDQLRHTGRPAEALRRAKLEMRSGKLTRAGGRRALALEATNAEPLDRSEPFYWSAFTVLSR